jgi:hypothetical protein
MNDFSHNSPATIPSSSGKCMRHMEGDQEVRHV